MMKAKQLYGDKGGRTWSGLRQHEKQHDLKTTIAQCFVGKFLEWQGCARFADFLQHFSKREILWSLCSVVFHAFRLKLPIQSSLSVAPKLPVPLSSHEKCPNFRRTSTPLIGVREGKF